MPTPPLTPDFTAPFGYINTYYKLNVRLGTRLVYQGVTFTVVEDCGNYIGAQLPDGGPTLRLHPTWEVTYLPDDPPRYRQLHLTGSLMPGEYRILPDGKLRLCCIDCGELLVCDDLDAIPPHSCNGSVKETL